jgi:hypothetical protein
MKRKYVIIAAASLPALALLWFTGVDWSWFVDRCPDCGYDRDVAVYRVFGIPVRKTVYEYPSPAQRISIDLGVGCSHPRIQHWHKHRWWGLCICRSPCVNGSLRASSDDSWYTDIVSSKLAALADRDPSIRDKFAVRVLQDHDWAYMWTILDSAGVNRSPGKK